MKPRQRPGRGFTLIDLLVVITITGTIAGTMTVVFSDLAARSASALHSREAATLANALVAEIKAMPFTFCDADDPRVATAQRASLGAGPTRCNVRVDGLGPEPGESRYGPGARFDAVSDYHGFNMPGPGCASLCARDGTPLPVAGRLAGCSVAAAVTPTALPGLVALDVDGQAQALRIVVTVRCAGAADTVAEAVRVRHAPNSR